jgi:hypothetical protein
MIENLNVKGSVRILKNGKEVLYKPNLIVNGGLNLIAKRLYDNTAGKPAYLGIGTGTTAATKLDTTLETALGDRQETFYNNNENKTVINATFGVEYVGSITEAGLFTELTGGTMLSRTTFSAISKTDEDVLVVEWTYTIGTWGS